MATALQVRILLASLVFQADTPPTVLRDGLPMKVTKYIQVHAFCRVLSNQVMIVMGRASGDL